METSAEVYQITEDDLITFAQFKRNFDPQEERWSIYRQMGLLTMVELYIVARTVGRMAHIGMNDEDRKLLKPRRKKNGSTKPRKGDKTA